MKIRNPFRWPSGHHRKARRQAAAIRAKTTAARRVLADTDAMLAGRTDSRS